MKVNIDRYMDSEYTIFFIGKIRKEGFEWRV